MQSVRVGDVLRLERRPITVDLLGEYREIGVRSFGRGIFHKEPITGSELGTKRVFHIEPGDLVFSNVFSWEGAVALAGDSERGLIGSHRFMTYVPRDDRLLPAWAAWFFVSEPGLELLGAASPGSAGRNRTLAIERFENLEIPLPPLDEQVNVAARLDQVAQAQGRLGPLAARSATLAESLPLAVGHDLAIRSARTETPLREALELVREPVEIDPVREYVTMGIRSFGRGVFHYPSRPGSEIGKLRFFSVRSGLLAISNIKAWEGAVATTSDAEEATVASNRFLFFRPRAGEDAVDFFWALLLGTDGLMALGAASPGSADRNRTLGLERFLDITLPLPGPDRQLEIGRRVRDIREALGTRSVLAQEVVLRSDALLSAAMREVFSAPG